MIPNCEDTDGDTIADFNDIDSDDDGIPDNIEAQFTISEIQILITMAHQILKKMGWQMLLVF